MNGANTTMPERFITTQKQANHQIDKHSFFERIKTAIEKQIENGQTTKKVALNHAN